MRLKKVGISEDDQVDMYLILIVVGLNALTNLMSMMCLYSLGVCLNIYQQEQTVNDIDAFIDRVLERNPPFYQMFWRQVIIPSKIG